jgi:hypothetical protein
MSDIIIYTPTESEEDMKEDGGKSPECSLRSFLDSSEDMTEGSESTSSLKRNDSDIAGNPDEVSCEFSDLSEKEMDDSNANGLLARADLPDSDENAKLDKTRNPCFDAPVNSMNESEPNPRLRLFPKRDAKCTTCGYHAYGKNDQSTPKTFNEAWRSKFWSLDGHRRAPTTSLMSSYDCLKRARIEHDMWTISAQSTALELAQSAQASYKDFMRDLEGDFHKSEAGDNDVNLEGSLHPIFRDNSFEIAIKDLLEATLEAREATETAEALALYPSHLINHLDDLDEIRRCLGKIEERYRELRNIDATPGRTFLAPTVPAILDKDITQLTIPKAAENGSPRPAKKKSRRGKRSGAKRREMREATPDATSSELVGSEVKNKEATKQNKMDANQEHANLIEIIFVISSLLWLITTLTLPGYRGRSTSWKVTYNGIGILIVLLWEISRTMRRSARF